MTNGFFAASFANSITLLAESISAAAQSPEASELFENVCLISKNVTDLISTHILHTDDGSPASRFKLTCHPGLHCFSVLNPDACRLILSYLEPKEACIMQSLCRFTRIVFIESLSSYWTYNLKFRFGYLSFESSNYSFAKYIELYSDELQSELGHLSSVAGIYDDIIKYNSVYKRGVIGLVSDLIYFDDLRIARTISRKRYMAMSTIITETEQDVLNFKTITHDHPGSSKSFLPLVNAERNQIIRGIDQQILSQQIVFPGYIGYVVNLLCLREEHEHLRLTVMWSLFRDMMLFETTEAKLEYKSLLEPIAQKDFWGVALTDFSEDDMKSAQPSCHAIHPRDLLKNLTPSVIRKEELEREIDNTRHSLALIRYSY